MRKAIKLTLAVVFMMGATSLFAQKFGRVNTQEIIVGMAEFKDMQTKMEAYNKELQDNMEAIQVELNTKFQDYQKNEATMTDATRQFKQKELQDLSTRREEFQQVAQQDYQKKYNELMQPIVEKAKDAIDKVSKAGAFTAIFDISTGSLAYFDEATLTDISAGVKKELGITDATPAAPAK